jgi:hypothetical protein
MRVGAEARERPRQAVGTLPDRKRPFVDDCRYEEPGGGIEGGPGANTDGRIRPGVTDKQADNGVSLDAQQATICGCAELSALELVNVISDAAVSAKTLARPGLVRALETLRAGTPPPLGGEARPPDALHARIGRPG